MPYYLVRVQNVSEEESALDASTGADSWFNRAVADSISDKIRSFDAILSARMKRMGRSLEVTGGVYFKALVECDRCLTEFTFEEQIPFRMLLESAPAGKKAEEDEDEEVTEDITEALDFSYYSGDEVDVGDLIRQHIVMAQPMTYVCTEECKGLCTRCGKNLNKGRCGCKTDNIESPFGVLKHFKT